MATLNKQVLYAVKSLLKGDIDKFHKIRLTIQTKEDMELLCDALFEFIINSHIKYGIRFLLTKEKHARIILNKATKVFKTKYDIINFFIIDYYGRDDFKIYEDIESIHKFNLELLDALGHFYTDIPNIPVINNIVRMCDKSDDIILLFFINESFWPAALKHVIYTRNAYVINYVLLHLDKKDISKIIYLLNERYSANQMLIYNNEIKEMKRLIGQKKYWVDPTCYNVTYFNECILQLLHYETVTQLFLQKLHLNNIKFFEVCCNYMIQKLDFRDKRISIEQHRARLVFDDNYKCLMKVLLRKCLTKRMLKFGDPASSDNLNERHLVDLIVTFIM